MSLLTELKNCLQKQEKTLQDIKWVGCKEFCIPTNTFLSLALCTPEYDVPEDLIVVGTDFWVERYVGDFFTHECWVYKSYPIQPHRIEIVKTLIPADLTAEETERMLQEQKRRNAPDCNEMWQLLYKK